MLKDFNEPKLLTNPQSNSISRFTWTRSFHEKIIIQLMLVGDSRVLITKTERQPIQKGKVSADSKMTYQFDSVKIEHKIVTEFQTLVVDKGFWGMKNNWNHSAIHDGAGWLLEVNEADRGYKMIFRDSPTGSGEKNFRAICQYLIRLTKNSEKLEVY